MPILEKKPLHFGLDQLQLSQKSGDPVSEMVIELVGRLQQLVTFTSGGQPVQVDGFVVQSYRTGQKKEFKIPSDGLFTVVDAPVGTQPMKSKRNNSDA